MDPIMPIFTAIALAVILVGLILTRMKQPLVIGYIIIGLILGPHVLKVISEPDVLNRFGSIGVLFLLFFVGMEVSLPRIISNWRVIVIGTLLQIAISVGLVAILGIWLDWPFERIILLGFVISLSSTAVVIKLLQAWQELDTEVGQDVLGILLVQDLTIIPMLIIINFLGGSKPSALDVTLQIFGGVAIIGLLLYLINKHEIRIPFAKALKHDHETQIFTALLICFGFALISDALRLSTALGAFLAGILIASAKETDWVHRSLEPFHVVFMAFFFVSIGLLLDVTFFIQNWEVIILLVGFALVTNTFINAAILRMFKIPWQRSLYTGAMLAQIGEFSFVLSMVGRQANIISETGHQIAIAVISLTLLFSPIWIITFRKLTRQ